MYPTQLNREALRAQAAHVPGPDAEHRAQLRLRDHPPPDGASPARPVALRPRRLAAAALLRLAHRLDGDVARRTIA